MATKNKRIILSEAELVDDSEIELTDILSSSSKSEKSILDLADKCLAFKDNKLKKMVLGLKARAAAVTEYISELGAHGIGGTTDHDIDTGMDDHNDIDSSNLSNTGEKQRLDMPESAELTESAKNRYLKRKKLKEADLEMEAESKNDIEKQADEELGKEQNVIKNNTFDNQSSEHGDKVIIDLREPFENVIKGLDTTEFESFKHDVVQHLENSIDAIEQQKDSTIADQFTKSIEALVASHTVDDFDLGMEQIYDFADQNDILIETIIKK